MTFPSRQCGAVLFAAVLPVCGCVSLLAQDAHGTAPAAPRLLVRVERGNIEVHGKEGASQVEWYAHIQHGHQRGQRKQSGFPAVSVTTVGNVLEIQGDQDVDLVVTMPARAAMVALRTDSGDLTLTDIATDAELLTDGGNVRVDHVTGQLHCHTDGGNVTLHTSGQANALSRLETGGGNMLLDAADGNMLATTGGGNVVVTAVHGNLKVESGGGNVTVHQAAGSVQLQTGSGNVEMGDIGGAVMAETGGGSIRLGSAKGMVRAETRAGAIDCRQLGSGLKAETGSGPIVAEYARDLHFLESRLETGSGNVTVWLPSQLRAAVQVAAENPFGHSITTEFHGIQVTNAHEDGELRAQGLMNGGGPLLRVETQNGNVELLRVK
jgi:DUF4097 and DUF4098 domain-containing protein YvlB